MDRPGAVDGRRPDGDGPGAALVLARREEALDAEEPVGSAEDPVDSPLGEAEVGEERRDVLVGEVVQLHLDLRRRPGQGDVSLAGEGAEVEPLDGVGRRVGVGDVHDDQEGLERQEREAAEPLLLLGRQPGRAQRPARLEHGQALLDRRPLRLELGRLRLLSLLLELLAAFLEEDVVGQDELSVEGGRVPGRVEASLVGHLGVLEGANDVDERVDVLQGREVDLLLLPLRDPRHVDELDGRRGVLLRREEGGEAVEPRVGDVRRADVRLPRGAEPVD